MAVAERKQLQQDFLRRVGPNAETFKALFDTLPDAAFYIMDDQDRIMAYNRRNCENSNIRTFKRLRRQTPARCRRAHFAP